MAGMKKLLYITLRRFAVFAILLVVVSLPLTYWAIWRIYRSEVDEALEEKTAEFVKRHSAGFTPANIALWNDYQRDMQIVPAGAGDTLPRWSDEMVFDSMEQEAVPYRSLRTPLPGLAGGRYQMVARTSVLETEDLVLALALLYCLLIGLLLLAWLWLTRRISRQLWRPFYDTLEKIRRFNLEHGETPVFSPVQVLEFQQLNDAVTQLAESNLQVWQQQKEFFENASHELQTPLAVLRAQLDLLAQDGSMSEEQSRSVVALTQSVSRLNRLNRNLLLLSKIDNRFYIDTADLDAAESLTRQLDFLQPLAEASNIYLKTSFLEPAPLRANAVLLDTLLSNLLTNAFRHNLTGGTVEVTLKNRKLEISNSGSRSLDVEQLFRRFAPGRSSDGQGTGLGLAIAQRAAEVSGWKLEYRWEHERHIFEVVF